MRSTNTQGWDRWATLFLIMIMTLLALVSLLAGCASASGGLTPELLHGAPGGAALLVVRHESCLSPSTDARCSGWYRPLEDPLGQMWFLVAEDGRACVVDEATFTVAIDQGFRCLRWRPRRAI